jgi:hypothetical protein
LEAFRISPVELPISPIPHLNHQHPATAGVVVEEVEDALAPVPARVVHVPVLVVVDNLPVETNKDWLL